jgi:hypothetical protein
MMRLVPTALLLTLLAPGVGLAKAHSELAYRVEEVFSTALRFVRIDRGCKITDKDPDAAFVMFECHVDDAHVSRGAIEIFRSLAHGKDGVRLSVSLPDEGHGPELRMVELIERKLRDERGTPTPPRPTPPAPPSDGGVKP